MKTLAFILSLYVVFLTVLPCADKYDCSVKKSVVVENNGRNASSDDLDGCSPFCTCNCCHVFSVTTLSFVIDFSVVLIEELPQWFVEKPVLSRLMGVWKPPQM